MKCPHLFFLCLLVLIATVAADAPAQRAKLKACLFKEMDEENRSSNFKFRPDDLEKLKAIVGKEVDKEPLAKHSDDEQYKAYKEMEQAAREDLPHVPTEKVDMFLHKLKDMAMHCAKEMGL